MRSPGRSARVLALAISALAGSLRAQTLNPVVTVLPRATSSVPQDCEQGLTAAPVPRVTPEEKKAAVVPPQPTEPVAPPSATLRDVMRDLQDAAERGDRDSFRTLFARAKSMVADYPPGAEKNAASEALKVYEDVGAFLDYQYDVPTGAFFDASTDGLLARLKAYPDFQRAIADQTIVDANGTRFYPTRETRAFLVREAAFRLQGGRAVTPVAPEPPKVAATPKPATPKVSTAPKVVPKPASTKPAATTTKTTRTATKRTSPAAPKTTTKTTTPKPATTARVGKPAAPKPATKREPVRIAESHTPPKLSEKPAPRKSEPAPPPAPPKRSPAPAVTETSAPPPPPPAPSPAPTQTAATETASTATTTTASATAAPMTSTTSTETTATEGTAESAKASRRNLILPLILIVVGVGVLILLFRTSS